MKALYYGMNGCKKHLWKFEITLKIVITINALENSQMNHVKNNNN